MFSFFFPTCLLHNFHYRVCVGIVFDEGVVLGPVVDEAIAGKGDAGDGVVLAQVHGNRSFLFSRLISCFNTHD